MKWKIYYSNGSTFSNRDGTWCEAPVEDIQIILTRSLDPAYYRVVLCGHSYFWSFDEGNQIYYGSDLSPLLHGDIPKVSSGWMKFGCWMDRTKYDLLRDRASKDTDFKGED